jgi:hypothetical protein
MRRHLLTITSIFSLVLFAATIAASAWSRAAYANWGAFYVTAGGHCFALEGSWPRLSALHHNGHDKRGLHGFVNRYGRTQHPDGTWSISEPGEPRAGSVLGWFYAGRHDSPVSVSKWVTMPTWFVAGLFAVLPALWVRGRLVRRQNRRRGHCPACGYDLRATPSRCPECGQVSVAKA